MFGPHFTSPADHEDDGQGGRQRLRPVDAEHHRGPARPVSCAEGEPLPLALMAWSLVHGLASLLVDQQLDSRGRSAPDAEELAIFQTRLLFEGLRRPPQNV